MDLFDLFLKERREHDRKPYSATAILLIQNQEYVCSVENISKGGALLSIDVSFPVSFGEMVDVQIPFSDGKRHIKKTAKVRRFSDKEIALKFLW